MAKQVMSFHDAIIYGNALLRALGSVYPIVFILAPSSRNTVMKTGNRGMYFEVLHFLFRKTERNLGCRPQRWKTMSVKGVGKILCKLVCLGIRCFLLFL
jgi:hypothetical protein